MNAVSESWACAALVGLDGPALGRLMPMHLYLCPEGRVRHAGPTVERLAGGNLCGRPFAEVVTLRRPRAAADMAGLLALAGLPLKLTLAAEPVLSLKGLVVALPDGEGALLNLSMGISLLDAVGKFDLTLHDFAPTDLAAELLYLTEAKSAVTGELRRLAQRLNGARVSAEEKAATDILTGLGNRRRLEATLKQFLGQGRPFALMHMDLDYFKQINDTHGHAVGDVVLCEVAERLTDECRVQDVVTRVGGDEFVILAVDIVDPLRLEKIAQRLISRLENPIQVEGIDCRISASIGLSVFTRHSAPDPARLMREADMALYESKGAGRARVTVYIPPEPPAGGDPG
ncbi:GGDEF domain-containing protein [Rhodovulum marinum]|uniref:Diguanylate cyclase n=1 Tax=Rhodovulum marinum TaxID=320662 RepID=A0A4R2Q0X5_9RHOB|nr:GGDEF domain-containing protein [Rhodovulum marinum]TCP41324.1 diguanylate cyclase [Rhodovulum marinum]